MKKLVGLSLLVLCSCSNEEKSSVVEFNNTFVEIGEVNIEGGKLAAEISAYDIETKRLFVNNNAVGNRVDIIDLSDPTNPKSVDHILLTPWPDDHLVINSLAIKDNKLAVAVADTDPQAPGIVFIFRTTDFIREAKVQVGAMPDMITFTPNGKYLITANEGEPNPDYTIDPEGSISIIRTDDFSVTSVNFDAFKSKQAQLEEGGFRIFGPNASFSQDIEPEYVTVSEDSKYAWVTLQENNGIAQFDIEEKRLIAIYPLGFKDFELNGNEIDVCDNGVISSGNWKIKGMYQPDALAVFSIAGQEYIITANEGDSRDYPGYSEVSRVGDLDLDSVNFPGRENLDSCQSLSRLFVTKTLGDEDGDGDYEKLYAFGTRSFSIWDGKTGKLVLDSKNRMEQDLIDNSDLYDDNRSDDKGVEPETVVIGYVGGTPVAFLALERANAIVSYDLSNPSEPKFLQVLETGIGPEGILFIDQEHSPNGRSLLIASSEVDGKIKMYQPQ